MGRPPKQSGQIYFLLSEKTNALKIGFTRNCLERRLKECNTWSPYDYDVLKVIPGTMIEERQLHKRFVRDHIKGEWFRYSDELKDYIAAL